MALFGLLATAAMACSGSSEYCMPNFTRTCTCSGGTSGTQQCDSTGSQFSTCSCAATDGGAETDNGSIDPCNVYGACDTCTANPGCGWCSGRCLTGTSSGSSDGMCSGTPWSYGSGSCPTTCAAVAENTLSACTDGCDNDGDSYVDCNDFNCCDLVTCGPTTSCGRRAMCVSCTSTGACPAGDECRSRACDARRACYPIGDLNASCDTVDGNPCPSVAAYDRCTSDADCGPLATCAADTPGSAVGWGWMVPRCNHTLSCQGMAGPGCSAYGPNPCPAPPNGYPGVTAACAVTGDSLRGPCYGCVLQCTAGAACPFGLHCSSGRCID